MIEHRSLLDHLLFPDSNARQSTWNIQETNIQEIKIQNLTKKVGKNQHNQYKQRQLETTITRLVTADNTTTQVQFKDRK